MLSLKVVSMASPQADMMRAGRPEGAPRPKAQHNYTDPESRIQERGGEYLQGYNAQAVVDADSQVIVAQGVTNMQPDNSHLAPMLDQVRENTGTMPDAALGDAGYWKAENVTYAEEQNVDLYFSPRRQKRGTDPPTDDHCDDATDQNPKQQMITKLQTDEGRALYARRKSTVEPVFGQIKEARGFRRFHLRGLAKVIGEWSLVSVTHNLLKLYRSQIAVAAT